MSMSRTGRAALLPLLLIAACKAKDETRIDTSAARAGARPMDSGMAGMSHARVSRSAPKDSNQSFLRMMSDHHEGLILMADSAMDKLGAAAKADAEKLRRKQMSEQQRMQAMLSRQYKESIHPVAPPSNQAMIDSVTKASGRDADRAFYRQVVAHHREGIRMSEQMLSHLTGGAKEMARKAIAEQKKEVSEFEKKAGAKP